ncbi:acyltransferase family protein [Gaetbulibacter saemankumensis]|uniref:acyltransferase family protein n=1 Tax=Gaetbulibacter saemankumensis TaxID=311208 RepID=UPI0003F588CE|nr:acyltransferase [Gaetbulibacter saemankumensis]
MFGTLRTFLAINVILLHVFSIPTLGNFSVSFFFILSGFLMTLIMHDSYSYKIRGITRFWKNRLLRLFPIYLIIIVLTIFLLKLGLNTSRHRHIYLPNTLGEWLANISMIYPNIVPHRFEPRLSPPSWALTNEMLFYLLISIGISKTQLRTLFWFILSVIYFAVTYFYYDIPTFRYSAVFASSLPFSIGAVLFWLIKKYPLKEVKLLHVGFLYVLFVLNAVYCNVVNDFLSDLSIYVNMFISTLIIYLLYFIDLGSSIRKIDKQIGLYSYPFYLSHYLVLMMYSVLIGYGVIDNTFKIGVKAMPFYFLFLAGVNYLLVHFVEMRVDRFKLQLKNKQFKAY